MEESINEEKGFLRWGGLAGIWAGIFLIVTIVTLVEFGPSTTATLPLMRVPVTANSKNESASCFRCESDEARPMILP
jgi:hypothetical protein